MYPRALEESFPLSPLQQAMLLHSLYTPESTAYVPHLRYTLHEPIDAATLQLAWMRVVERHPVLRTGFRWEGLPEPRQDVHRQVELPWEEHDLRTLAATEQEARIDAHLAASRRRRFDFAAPPLLRLALYRTGEADYRLTCLFHHVLFDGGSSLRISREVFAIYDALRRGIEPPLRSSRSFGPYVDWLRHLDLGPAEAFWRDALDGVAAPAPLSVERPRGEHPPYDDYGAQWASLPIAVTDALLALARAHGLTLNTMLMGAVAVLLGRYGGTDDVVFGTTRSVRGTAPGGADDAIGLYMNTVPMRVRLPPRSTVLALLAAIRKRWTDTRAHEHTPLPKIQACTGVPPGRPLFEALVVFENSAIGDVLRAQGGAWEARDVTDWGSNPLPLTFFGRLSGELRVRITHDRSRFADDTIRRMHGHLSTLLEAFVADPHRALEDLPLLTVAERRQLLVEWNDTRRDYPRAACLHELFAVQAQRTPDADALVCGGERLTYAALNRRANALAHHLRALGVRPDALVGLHLPRSVDMVVALLGILKAGGAYVPLDPRHSAERIAFVLQDARIEVVITRAGPAAALPAAGIRVIRMDADGPAVAAGDDADPPSATTPENLAYVIYTSGSTGRPKGVLIEHRQILNYVQAITERCAFAPGMSFAMVQPLAVDSSQTTIFPALACGGCLHVIPEETAADPHLLAAHFASTPVDVLKIAPSHLAALQASPKSTQILPRRCLVIGGEASRRDWAQALAATASCAVVNHYGPTETTVGVLTYRVERGAGGAGSATLPIGRPLPNVRAYVLDAARQPVPVGVPGELYIGGDCVARGYLNRPELTAAAFVADPFARAPGARLYRTGDLARWLPAGNIEFLGRRDDQVKIRGFRVEIGEVEAALRRHAGVRDCVVIAREDAGQPRRLVAYAVPAGQPAPGAAELREHLRRELPAPMVPSQVVLLDALPRSAHGKLDRRALPVPDGGGTAGAEPVVGPRTPLESALANLWAELLQRERFGVHDDFFDHGGHSLLAMQLVGRIREAFGVELPMHQLFDAPTIAALAAAIREARAQQDIAAAAGGPPRGAKAR